VVTAQIQKYINGAYNATLATGTLTPQVGDDIECGVVGSTITLKQIRSGSTVTAFSVSDSAIASGSPGIRLTFYPNAGGALTENTMTLWTGYELAITAGVGTGLLDEDGTSSWWPVGDPVSVVAFPDPTVGAIPTDMVVFLGLTLAQYTKPVHDWIAANLPHHMIGSTNQAGYGRRLTQYTAEANNADVLLFSNSVTGVLSDFSTPTISHYNSIPKPVYVGVYLTAQPDSQFAASACPYQPALCFLTQDSKGGNYLSLASSLYSSVNGGDGYGIINGIDYWQYTDNSSEQGAYGLVSLNDNLYGYPPACPTKKEDVNSSIIDCYGFTTTPETTTYGNFVNSGVVAGNAVWLGSQPIVVTITQQPPASLQVNAAASITATVANDGGAAGVDWTLTCGGGTCGTITTHTASGAAATYTAPAAVPPGAVVAKATSTTDNTKSASANGITITTAANVICCVPKNGGWLP